MTITDPKERFLFGENWRRFLQTLDERRIQKAEKSLKSYLKCESLKGKTFLDVGSGSGLFSLAAYRLGAHVVSFDYDHSSVGCTQYLQAKFCDDAERWRVMQGSVLDTQFLESLGIFDIVYSWGVLHHTGHMYQAFENVVPLVREGGSLFIAIYNDQGAPSRRWLWIKKTYVQNGIFVRTLLAGYTLVRQWTKRILMDTFLTGNPLKSWNAYGQERGMSAYYDLIDWVGGYPFEVAKPEEVFEFFHARGFTLEKLKTCAAGLGCNEFVFHKKG